MAYRLKTPDSIEHAITDTYKKIENGVVGSYKKFEKKFVDTFLEEVPDDTEENSSEQH